MKKRTRYVILVGTVGMFLWQRDCAVRVPGQGPSAEQQKKDEGEAAPAIGQTGYDPSKPPQTAVAPRRPPPRPGRPPVGARRGARRGHRRGSGGDAGTGAAVGAAAARGQIAGKRGPAKPGRPATAAGAKLAAGRLRKGTQRLSRGTRLHR